MKIGVLHPDSSWILSTIAQRLCTADAKHFEAWDGSRLMAEYGKKVFPYDGWLYWDLQNCWTPSLRAAFPHAIHIAAFTHLDKDDNSSMRDHWHGKNGPDAIIHMAQRYYDRFVEQGWYCPEQMIVLRPGEVAYLPLKKVKIGICQRGEHVGKGAEFLPCVLRSLDTEIKDALELHFCGRGWLEAINPQWGVKWGRAVFYHGVEATNWTERMFDKLPDMVDYLLIPSLYEGGPMALLEALATGIPIIAANVGWVNDFYEELGNQSRSSGETSVGSSWAGRPPEFWVYPPGNMTALQTILTSLVRRRLDRRAIVASMSYRRYAADVLAFFERVKERGI